MADLEDTSKAAELEASLDELLDTFKAELEASLDELLDTMVDMVLATDDPKLVVRATEEAMKSLVLEYIVKMVLVRDPELRRIMLEHAE